MKHRDQADVADDFAVFFPYVAEKRVGGLLSGARQPAQMIVIVCRTADVAQIGVPVRVHVAAKTHFNQVGSF